MNKYVSLRKYFHKPYNFYKPQLEIISDDPPPRHPSNVHFRHFLTRPKFSVKILVKRLSILRIRQTL